MAFPAPISLCGFRPGEAAPFTATASPEALVLRQGSGGVSTRVRCAEYLSAQAGLRSPVGGSARASLWQVNPSRQPEALCTSDPRYILNALVSLSRLGE